MCGIRCSSKEQLFKVPMKWKIEVLKNRRIWKAFKIKSKEEWRFPFCHISSRSRDIQDFCIMQIRYWWRSLFCVLTSILSHLMTSSVPSLHNTKILNISGTRWDMTKRKTPFFTFKGLSNSPIFQCLNFSLHRHLNFQDSFTKFSSHFRTKFLITRIAGLKKKISLLCSGLEPRKGLVSYCFCSITALYKSLNK